MLCASRCVACLFGPFWARCKLLEALEQRQVYPASSWYPNVLRSCRWRPVSMPLVRSEEGIALSTFDMLPDVAHMN